MAVAPKRPDARRGQARFVNPQDEGFALRLVEVERVLWGTADHDGIVSDMKAIKGLLEFLKRWGNRWGMILLGAFMASGVLNGNAAHTIGQFLAGLK